MTRLRRPIRESIWIDPLPDTLLADSAQALKRSTRGAKVSSLSWHCFAPALCKRSRAPCARVLILRDVCVGLDARKKAHNLLSMTVSAINQDTRHLASPRVTSVKTGYQHA